jgi:hypothetical protein
MQRDASHETSLPEKPVSGTLHDDVLLGRSITDLTMSPAMDEERKAGADLNQDAGRRWLSLLSRSR